MIEFDKQISFVIANIRLPPQCNAQTPVIIRTYNHEYNNIKHLGPKTTTKQLKFRVRQTMQVCDANFLPATNPKIST
jgi:transposase